MVCLEGRFKVKETCSVIQEKGFVKVALQFPDELLAFGPQVYGLLKKELDHVDFYLMADTTYGSCCVDEVAAEHAKCQLIVHYGHSCLSKPSRLPAYFVFDNKSIEDISVEIEKLRNGIMSLPEDRSSIQIRFQPCYLYCREQVLDYLSTSCSDRIITSPEIPLFVDPTEEVVQEGDESDDNAHILYFGDESLGECNLILKHGNNDRISCFRPEGSSFIRSPGQDVIPLGRLLRKRFYLIESVKAASIIGLVVCTTSIRRFGDLLNRVKEICSRAGRKTYTLVMGKINPAKLANFLEIDLFVLVGCPEDSALLLGCDQNHVGQHDYMKPMVSPFELEVALSKGSQWNGQILTNFEDILNCGGGVVVESDGGESDGESDDEDVPMFSLTSGSLHSSSGRLSKDSLTTFNSSSSASSSLVSTSSGQKQVISFSASPAAERFFQNRTFTGLESNSDESSRSTSISVGRAGIASSYSDEPLK